MNETEVNTIFKSLKARHLKIESAQKQYLQLSVEEKKESFEESKQEINHAEKDIKSLEMEINMLSMEDKRAYLIKLNKYRTRYNQCRQLVFNMEDNLEKTQEKMT
jgi:chromosome segregation ATPase